MPVSDNNALISLTKLDCEFCFFKIPSDKALTFFPTVAPTIFTVLLELLLLSVPVAAWFPPPNTLFVTLLFPSIIKLVFPYTIADTPFPPAYKLLFKVEFLTLTYVFPVTVPSFPPPYTLSATFPPERVTFVFVLTPAWFPPPNIYLIVPPVVITFDDIVVPPKLFPPYAFDTFPDSI